MQCSVAAGTQLAPSNQTLEQPAEQVVVEIAWFLESAFPFATRNCYFVRQCEGSVCRQARNAVAYYNPPLMVESCPMQVPGIAALKFGFNATLLSWNLKIVLGINDHGPKDEPS